ncbi:PKD domain-containing protein [Methanosarcina sp. Z-7115]|uniref:PKD domain-containing protein n=1 Tax=Methanosarcina baikalica TaxID=3073890 RepID=A0ABU2D261_9EURY|nr:PKD domain-containing protein [Methanosarcina sp. Z-7115]MDR7666032.1 PKD domain-containing protein [Methanosarcina sp. Z-7115]
MKNLKTLMTIFIFSLFFLVLSSSVALATNIVVDKEAGPAGPDIFHTPNYTNDSACIQAALNYSQSGDTITIHGGDYYLPKEIYQRNKSLNIIGKGKVTLHLQTPDRGMDKEVNREIFFNGSNITNTKLSANAKKGSSQLVLTDASQVRQDDLIKIWKNVQWCPLDYPDQMTGEMYAVKNVNGNVITLNQPLLRDYRLSETVQVEVYRPIQMHIKNIRVEDTGNTTIHHGIVLQYCKDSSVTNSWLNNSGFGDLCLYSCFNVSINNNQIYNALHHDCGYGINVASGSAFVNISHNHIENCRHTISGNSDELKSLNRDVFIADNTLIGAETVRGSWVVDAHAVTIDFFVTRNKIYPQLPYFYAFSDGTQQSTFTNNEIYGGYGGIFKRGGVSDGVHIYENNTFNDMAGEIYRGGDGIDNMLIIRNNTQNKGIYGIRFPYKGSVRNIIISNNRFSNLSNQGMNQKFLMNGVNLTISENTFANIKYEGISLDGNSFKNGAVKIKNNTLINVNPPNYSFGITVKNVKNAEISGNKISKTPVPQAPVADFSASPTSGKAPLKVKFKSTSTGDPTAWKWNFGDGSALVTEQNPEHTYSKTGVYTVKHTAINAYGRDTEIKTSYIKVTTSAKPVAAFSASPTSGKAPLNVAFTDKSTGSPTSWKWSFGDGTYSTVKSPVHKYTKAGKYTVSLIVNNAKGSNTKTMSGYLTVSKK